MSRKTITIKDVAKTAGVSTATVSRALSNPEAVTESTRLAVLDAAQRTGYQLNQAARNLRLQQTQVIVVLVPNLGNPFFARILSGIETTASAAGMSVLIADTNLPGNRADFVRRYQTTARTDGLIVMDGSISEELLETQNPAQSVPPVVFACEWATTEHLPSVRTDNRGGARMAVEHLVKQGHRKIGYIAGPLTNVLTAEREAGMMDALNAASLVIPQSWMFEGDFTVESGARAADEFMALRERPTGVFCASDQMAIGFISALNRKGVRTPQDVSVVGFDDIDIAPHFIPALTTIRQPTELIGSTAAKLLIDTIRSEAAHSTHQPIVLPVELIVRKSSASLI